MKQTKRQLIDLCLFLYGGIVSFSLTGYAIVNLKNTNGILTLVLFLPISLYFLVRLISSLAFFIGKAINIDQKRHPYFGRFSLATFINQSETTFLINLFLLALAVSLILFRISLNIIK